MSLNKLDIYSLRNIQKASIEPATGINLIVGKNASGKSSLLEAVYILGRARSFRAKKIQQVIKINKQELIVSGKVNHKNKEQLSLGIKLNGRQCEIRINQENKDRAELAYSFPVLLIHPKSYLLLDGSPQIRREFLDWGIFNIDKNFLKHWRTYKKILQQRNALLKSKQIKQIDVWNTELIQYGTIVSKHRKEYLEKLTPIFIKISQYFFHFTKIELNYLTGLSETDCFKTSLANDFQKDVRYGFTHSGPHRSDFQLKVNNQLAKDFVSRGQLKLLMLALKLAQVKLTNLENKNDICVLIDDLSAELDVDNRTRLLSFLDGLKCQVFLTATELVNFGDLTQLNEIKVFHVKHGEIELIGNT